MKSKKYHQVVLTIFILITLFSNNVLIYYTDGFNDFFVKIINSSSNIGGVIVASFLFYLFIKTNKSFYGISIFVTIGFIGYELLQIIMPWQTFDIIDIIGSIIGCIVACLLHLPHVFLTQNKLINVK